jgi:hypothetical protein
MNRSSLHSAVGTLLLGAVACFTAISARGQTASGGGIGPRFADSVVAIQFRAEHIPLDSAQFARDHAELRNDYAPWRLGRGFYVFGLVPGSDVETAAGSLRLAPEVLVVNPVLEGAPGHNVWMTDQVVVKLGETTTGAQVESLNVALAAYANPPDPRRPREYYVRINPALRRSALEIAESYRQSGLCEFA